MATAVLRFHDALNNRMHLDAFTPSPAKPRRRRSPKPAGASSPPPKVAAVASSPPKSTAFPKMPAVAAPAPKAAAVVASPPAKGRRSPPPKPAARKQPSPTKEKPSPIKEKRIVMEEVRILRRGEEPPAPAPAPATPVPVVATPVAQAAAVNKRVGRSPGRAGPKEPTMPSRKAVSAPDVAVYAGPAFATAPEPSSLPFPAFCLRRAETEATRGLRCLLGIDQVA